MYFECGGITVNQKIVADVQSTVGKSIVEAIELRVDGGKVEMEWR